jgi:hypothetical protein
VCASAARACGARAEATLAWDVIAAAPPTLGMSNCAAKFFPGTRAVPFKPSPDVDPEAILLFIASSYSRQHWL